MSLAPSASGDEPTPRSEPRTMRSVGEGGWYLRLGGVVSGKLKYMYAHSHLAGTHLQVLYMYSTAQSEWGLLVDLRE